MKGALIAVGVVVLIVLILGGTLMGDRNDLVTEREAIKSSFAQVDNQMQRRADLIPNLVATVKGMPRHEQSVIDSVTKARAQMAGAQTPAPAAPAITSRTVAVSRNAVRCAGSEISPAIPRTSASARLKASAAPPGRFRASSRRPSAT